MQQRLLKAFEVLLFGTDNPSAHGEARNVTRSSVVEAAALPVDKTRHSKVVEEEVDHISNDTDSNKPRRESSDAPFESPRVNSISSLVENWMRGDPGSEPLWRPSTFQLRPLTGLFALWITVCCVFAALVILVVSDRQPVEDWKIQPTVYLAIVAAVSNTALIYARCRATPSLWWYHASRGATIESLQRHWQTSQSLSGALINGRHPSLLTLICIATSLVMIDGPLLQRASTVVPTQSSHNTTLSLKLPPELPDGFSGEFINHIFWGTPVAAKLALDWMNGTAMHLDLPGCKGSCKTTVHGPGLAQHNCTSQSWPITPPMMHDINATWGTWRSYSIDSNGFGVASLPAFFIGLSLVDYSDESMRELVWLDVGSINITNLAGAYKQKACAFAPAVVEYDIRVEGNVVTLDGETNQGRFVRWANNTKPPDVADVHVKQPTTLDAITYFLQAFVQTNASVALNAEGGAAAIYSPATISYNTEAMKHFNWSSGPLDLSYYDPTPNVIWKYNQMMFRGALLSANWPNITRLIDADESAHQTVRVEETIKYTAYKTDFRWYAGAATFELLTALLVLPMFWGWWTLGRPVTLSPLEIALAFDSPLLKDVNSAAGATGVVMKIGKKRVRYGAVEQNESPQVVSNRTDHEDVVASRLGLATSDNVTRPRKGSRFRS